MTKIKFSGGGIPSELISVAFGVPRDAVTSFAAFLVGKTISCGCIVSSGMHAWSLACGRLGQIESGHRADSKIDLPCRTGESIQPLASGDRNCQMRAAHVRSCHRAKLLAVILRGS